MLRPGGKLALAAILCLQAHFCLALNSRGSSFIISFLENAVDYWQDLPLEIWAINDGPNPVTVTMSAPRMPSMIDPSCGGSVTSTTIQSGSQFAFKACWFARIMNLDSSINGKVIRLESTGDITVIGVNKDTVTAESFLALPISSLGTNYYPVTAGDSNKPNMIAVAATTDDTTVSVTLPTNEGAEITVNHRCLVYGSGSSFTVRLSANEVFYISSLADLTSAQIMSSNPVAVFSGNARVAIPSTQKARDHICEQAISVGNWDKQYFYTPISSGEGDYIRLLSAKDNTRIDWIDSNGIADSMTLNKGEWKEVYLQYLTYFYSDDTFEAVLLVPTENLPNGVPKDPAMINLPGINQMKNSYHVPAFITGTSTNNGNPARPFDSNKIFIIIPSVGVSGLRMDNQVQNFVCEEAPANVPASVSGYQACTLTFDGSVPHTFTHQAGSSFSASVFHSTTFESLGHSLGLEMAALCEERVMRYGDGYDNDCDGFIDEETCDSIDNDSDGRIDEDCMATTGQAQGRTYVVAFPDNSKTDGVPGEVDTLELYISPQSTTAETFVTISNPGGTFSTSVRADPGMTTFVNVPSDLRFPSESGKYNKAILVEADSDITLYALNKIQFSSESYLALPIDATGYDYFTVSTEVKNSGDAAEFTVCASEPGDTNVRITLGSGSSVSVNYRGSAYGPGNVITDTLTQFQCMQIQSSGDHTGSRVFSTNQKRISVFSGNRRPVVGNGNARDHIIEQIPPVTTWGTEFYTNPVKRDGTQGNSRGDIFKIVASTANTEVVITSTITANSKTVTIVNAGEFMTEEVGSNEYWMIRSDNPILVVQLTKTQLNNDDTVDKGDPSMSVVIPKESWTNEYRFVTPLSGQRSSDGSFLPYDNRMSILIEKQYIEKLMYNSTSFGNKFPNVLWVDVPGTNPQISASTVDITTGQNYVSTLDDVPFSVMLYGAADREFYAHPASLKLSQTQCIKTTMVEGDGVDNDCDELNDEEVCNGLDDDRDGLIDEDCSLPPTGDNGRFMINFMENTVEAPLDYPLSIYVFPRCSETTSVRMRTPNSPSGQSCDINVMIPAGGMQHFLLPYYYKTEGSGRFNRTILLETSCAVDITAYSSERFSNDAYLSLPETSLGTEYRIMTYYPVTNAGLLSVTATADAEVDITLPIHPDNTLSNPTVVNINNPSASEVQAGQTMRVSLKKYENLQLRSSGDLTGTIVKSNGPKLSVLSGNERVGILSRSRDHLVEQTPPWSAAASEWNVVSNGMTLSEFVKVLCEENTMITFPGESGENPTTFMFNSAGGESAPPPAGVRLINGQTFTYQVRQFYAQKVTASKQVVSNSVGGKCQLILVTRSQDGKDASLKGDPSMTYLIPVVEYITSARFAPPVKPNGVAYQSTLVVVALTGRTNVIRLDNNTISGWQPIPNSLYSYVRTQVTPLANGRSNLIESTDGSKFEARLWGVADRDSFSYPLGMNLSP